MGFRAEEVRPQRWSITHVLFDNGTYSVISGAIREHDGSTTAQLAERWNGREGNPGFPNARGHPTWNGLPSFLAVPLLHGLLDELARHPNEQAPESNIAPGTEAQVRTARVLEELRQQLCEAR
jgi:hypothetical protein